MCFCVVFFIVLVMYELLSNDYHCFCGFFYVSCALFVFYGYLVDFGVVRIKIEKIS